MAKELIITVNLKPVLHHQSKMRYLRIISLATLKDIATKKQDVS